MTKDFNGLRVTSFESRRSKEMNKLISYHGGVPRVAPSMKELPVETKDTEKFYGDLLEGNVDVLILFTGVGTRILSEQIVKKHEASEYKKALNTTKKIARGPKPVAALKEMGLKPDVTIPEPNTWRDIISIIDNSSDIEGKVVYVQEYGIPNKEFINELKKRGAVVKTITVYKWGLPDDLDPLENAIQSILDKSEDFVLFTSSQQVVNLFEIAERNGLKDKLYNAFSNVVVGSIGPTTTETLARYLISADYEPDSPKMGTFVKELARVSNELLAKKRAAINVGVETTNWKRIDMNWEDGKGERSEFLNACYLENKNYTPIWLMRQAGRFMRQYREIRSKVSFIELCKSPELAAEVTLMAAEKLNVDAAIIFSDILLLLQPLGVDLEYSKNDGPRINKTLRSSKAVDSLVEFDDEEMEFVYRAVEITRRALHPGKALIGFAGAPFTVASYAIEGGGSKNFIHTKSIMFRDPGLWNSLMIVLTDATIKYLNAQIKAGADAVQIFDSWVGCLSPDDYREFVLPHMKKLVGSIERSVPVILFGTDTSSLLENIKETGCRVVGVDWRVDISEAWGRIGYDRAIQGNLDPVALLSTQSYVKNEARKLLDKIDGKQGHIFNLGHGVLPGTPVENVLTLIDTVHEYSYKGNGR